MMTTYLFPFFQDALLKNLVEEHNENWEMIAKNFPDRSDVQCQQRWLKVVNPALVKGPWTKEVRLRAFSTRKRKQA